MKEEIHQEIMEKKCQDKEKKQAWIKFINKLEEVKDKEKEEELKQKEMQKKREEKEA